MPGQLKVLKSGRHPKTFAPIPRPVTIKQWEARMLQQPIPISALTPRPPLTLADDGASLTQAFIRGGKREAEHREDRPPIDSLRARLKRRVAMPMDPERLPEDYLNAEQLAQPALVEAWLEFWCEDEQQQL